MKYKVGDTVLVTAGKDKGRKGKIEKIFPKEDRVFIPGVNMYKRHMKRRDEKNPGGITDVSRSLPTGSIAIICPKCNKPTRAGYMVTGDEKVRICKKCEQKL